MNGNMMLEEDTQKYPEARLEEALTPKMILRKGI